MEYIVTNRELRSKLGKYSSIFICSSLVSARWAWCVKKSSTFSKYNFSSSSCLSICTLLLLSSNSNIFSPGPDRLCPAKRNASSKLALAVLTGAAHGKSPDAAPTLPDKVKIIPISHLFRKKRVQFLYFSQYFEPLLLIQAHDGVPRQ